MDSAKIQYLHTLVRGEVLRKFDVFSAEVESDISETLTSIIFGLGAYFFPVNSLSKKNIAIHRKISKPHSLKVRHYSNYLVDLND